MPTVLYDFIRTCLQENRAKYCKIFTSFPVCQDATESTAASLLVVRSPSAFRATERNLLLVYRRRVRWVAGWRQKMLSMLSATTSMATATREHIRWIKTHATPKLHDYEV